MNKEFTKAKKRFIALICFIIILVITFLLTRGCADRRDTGGAESTLPDVTLSGDAGYAELDSGSVTIKATSGMVLKAGTLEQSVDIENRADNAYGFMIMIYLGDGTLLYESDYISPGSSITDIELLCELEPGIYSDSVMVYIFCDGSEAHTAVSQCEIPIEIKCVN